MERISEMVGKPVMSAGNGEQVGSVADLLVTSAGDRIVGLVLHAGLLTGERVLPYDDVQAIGRDALIARTDEHVMVPRAWHDRGIAAERSSSLRHKRVVTDDGRQLGRIKDVYVDGATGHVRAYEIEGRGFAGLVATRAALPRTDAVRIGPDAMIVPQDAARALESGEDESRVG